MEFSATREATLKNTWFIHPEPLDTKTADELLARYAARQVEAKKDTGI